MSPTITSPAPGTRVAFIWAPPVGVSRRRTGTVLETKTKQATYGRYEPLADITSVQCDDGETVWTFTANLTVLP